MTVEIKTRDELIRTIRKARNVFITPRFGVMDIAMRVSKKEALLLAERIKPNATPQCCEMYGGVFATYVDCDLYLG